MRLRLLLWASMASAILLGASSAGAQTATDSFTVSATVVDSCSVTANDLSFGNYDINDASPTDQTTTVDVTCSLGTTYTVSLSDGIGAGATTAARQMTSTSDTLEYSLYQDSTRLSLWGSNTGVGTVAGVGTGASQTLTVYGRIPAGQTGKDVDSYSDTIQVTVSFP